MSFVDKARNKTQQLAGTAKEKLGEATKDKRMQAEGARQQFEGKAKQAGEQVKDAGRDLRGG